MHAPIVESAMKALSCEVLLRVRFALTALLMVVFSGQPVQAQSSCSSDGQPRPAQLLERFIDADCADCWQDAATPKAGRGQLALDWVVPGSQGESAPLSAVATRDAARRLTSLNESLPAASTSRRSRARSLESHQLRVAHGLPLGGYIGASIALKTVPRAAQGRQWTANLALVEMLPAGTENSPVPRNLVRNVFQSSWDGRKQLSKAEQSDWFEQRSMGIPDGVDPSRLRVVGWIDDEQGKLIAVAASRCVRDRR